MGVILCDVCCFSCCALNNGNISHSGSSKTLNHVIFTKNMLEKEKSRVKMVNRVSIMCEYFVT